MRNKISLVVHSLSGKFLISIIGSIVLVLFFQNCGRFSTVEDPLSSGQLPQVLGEENRKNEFSESLLPDCLNSSGHGACVIYKNLWAQRKKLGQAQDGFVRRSIAGLSNEQVFVVDWPTLLNDELSNSYVTVLNAQGQPARINGANYKVSCDIDDNGFIQIQNFHWAVRMMQLMEKWGAPLNLSAPIKINPFSEFTGWSKEKNTIFLTYMPGKSIVAADSSAVVHLLAEASIDLISQSKLGDFSSDKSHIDCGKNGGTIYLQECCSSGNGCGNALSLGLADYFTGVLFADAPAIGEQIAGSDDGISYCGVTRNPSSNSNLELKKAFMACALDGRPGYIYTMAAFLTSTLWAIRSELNGADQIQWDRLVVQTISQLSGSDTFSSFFSKLSQLDAKMFDRRFSDKIRAVTDRKGLAF